MTNETAEKAVVRVDAEDFAAKCLDLVDEVARGGGEVVITKGGRPVSRLVACSDQQAAPELEKAEPESGEPEKSGMQFGAYCGRMRILGDVTSPPDDIDWDAWADEQYELYYKDLGKRS